MHPGPDCGKRCHWAQNYYDVVILQIDVYFINALYLYSYLYLYLYISVMSLLLVPKEIQEYLPDR